MKTSDKFWLTLLGVIFIYATIWAIDIQLLTDYGDNHHVSTYSGYSYCDRIIGCSYGCTSDTKYPSGIESFFSAFIVCVWGIILIAKSIFLFFTGIKNLNTILDGPQDN